MNTLFWLTTGCGLVWLYAFGRTLRSFLAWTDPGELPPTKLSPEEPKDLPTVAMIVPAHNEVHRLPRCLPTLLAQDYPHLQMFFVDDCSTDGTLAYLREQTASDPRVTVIEGAPHPEGWIGKPWALHQGIEQSQSDWLLLVDADIRLTPQATERAVRHAQQLGVDLYSLVPFIASMSFWERITCLAMGTALIVVFPLHLVNNPEKKTAIAAGGFLLLRRRVHTELGGEELISHEIAEDLKRAVHAKQAGHAIYLSTSRTLLETDWYGTLAQIWQGLRKNAYAGFEYNPWLFWFLTILGLTWVWTPVLATGIGLATGNGLLAATGAASWLLQGLCGLSMIVFLKLPWYYGVILPFGFTLYNLIAITSFWDFHFGGGPKWSGRRFAAQTVKGPGKGRDRK